MPGQDKRVVVIGGGLAGISAALDLAAAGLPVTLLEQDDFIGGHSAQLTCKAVAQCQSCNGCLAESRLAQVLAEPLVEIRRRCRTLKVEAAPDGYRLQVQERPALINPLACTACGQCLEACPEPGVIRMAPLPGDLPRLAIDPQKCLFFQDQRSTMCRDVCPEEAISFAGEPASFELAAQAVVLASGFAAFDPRARTRWGYGQLPEVITGLELEEQLRSLGRPRRPGDGALPERVAFIQCVGSREAAGNNYCSRVCCGYALRLGRVLAGRFGAKVSVFYMDLQSFGHAIDEFLAAAHGELELIRCLPYDPQPLPGGGLRLEYQAEAGQPLVSRDFDLLVLSVGISPGAGNASLAQTFGLARDQHGFLRPDPDLAPGVFVAGAAGRPMDQAEAVASAGRAAHQVLSYLREQ